MVTAVAHSWATRLVIPRTAAAGLLLEGVLELLTSLLEVPLGLVGLAFSLQVGIARGVAYRLLDLALGLGDLVRCLVFGRHDSSSRCSSSLQTLSAGAPAKHRPAPGAPGHLRHGGVADAGSRPQSASCPLDFRGPSRSSSSPSADFPTPASPATSTSRPSPPRASRAYSASDARCDSRSS